MCILHLQYLNQQLSYTHIPKKSNWIETDETMEVTAGRQLKVQGWKN